MRSSLSSTSDELADVLDLMHLPHVCTSRDDLAIAVVPGALAEPSFAELATRFAAGGRRDVVLGVSGPKHAQQARSGLSEATRAAGSARTAHRPVVTYQSLELEALLDDAHVRARVTDLAGSRLVALLDSDRKAQRDLVGTLRTFLETNGSWETASRRLGVHRQTLRQRIERVQAETGLDLDSAQTRAATLLVLLTHERSNAAQR